MDLNLDTLKREILDYLDANAFAVFRSSPGGLEGLPMVLWDTEHFPDYQAFLDVAQKCGVRLVMFASAEFDANDIDELTSHLDECELERDERRDYESRLRDMRIYAGVTCSLEIAYSYDSRLYVYEVQPDWYDDFCTIEEEIMERLAGEEPDVEGDSLGGYFSNN
ncbi:MAG TPA: hypothetical protein VKB88_46855 [Bryobacteraceae bacterium]|nr:hypothetical protein [Bryobacteraceae bacterium]